MPTHVTTPPRPGRALRRTIAGVLVQGFGGETTAAEAEDRTLVYAEGYPHPITVLDDDMLIPECYPDVVVAGIRLDVHAILAGL